MKLRKRSSARWGAPRGRPTKTTSLLLDPPLLDVVQGRIRSGVEVLEGLLRDSQRVVDVAEVVRLVLVQDLVEGLVVRFARRRRAVAIRWVAPLLDGFVQRRIPEACEREALRFLRGVGDVGGVPASVRIGIAAKAPTDDRRLERLVAGGELGHETLERFRTCLRVDTELLVLIGSDLGQRLALLVTRVRRDREAELLAILGEEAVGSRDPAGVLQKLKRLGLVVFVGLERAGRVRPLH